MKTCDCAREGKWWLGEHRPERADRSACPKWVPIADEVASLAKQGREAIAGRDAAIRAMRYEGASLRTIADAAGLTHTAIAKILSRASVE